MTKKKLFRLTTISASLGGLLKGQLMFLNDFYEVTGIASEKYGLQQVSEREKIKTIEISMAREINLLRDIYSLFLLIALFIKERPYIVHANTPKASLLSMLAGWTARVPHRVYTVTGLRFETTTGNFRRLLIIMEKITCWAATKVIPEGEGVKRTLLREKITNKPMSLIHYGNINGIDTKHYSQSPEANILASSLNEKFTFCFVGRMVMDKGINELVSAFIQLYKETDSIQLFLVGPFEDELDPVLPEIKEKILTHPGISYVGFQQDVRPYFATSDVLVFPSYREGFPNVVLQAGAMELPSIVTNISGCNEIITEGVNGSIIPVKNVDELYKAMKIYYNLSPDERKIMGKNARSNIVQKFEQKDVWEALLKMYNSLD